jgi:hypothetical protein
MLQCSNVLTNTGSRATVASVPYAEDVGQA